MALPIALLTLAQIKHISGSGNVGNSFAIHIQSMGEITDFQTPLPSGLSAAFNDALVGQEPPLSSPAVFSISIVATGLDPTHPSSGSYSTTITVPIAPIIQNFVVSVPISGPHGSATLNFTIDARWREYPVSYDPSWLCRNRNDLTAFQHWLCLGIQNIGGFLSLAPVLDLQTHMLAYLNQLERLNMQLTLGYLPATFPFIELVDYTFNVAMAAAPQVNLVNWRWGYILSDFIAGVQGHIKNYIGIGVPTLVPSIWGVCNKWRELLECFCRFCTLRATLALPQPIKDYFDQTMVEVEDLHIELMSIAQNVNLKYTFSPFITQPCDRLQAMVSFWAWWCRICNDGIPLWAGSLDPYYATLFHARDELQRMLHAESITICDLPSADLCKRWLAVLDCLGTLCARKGSFSWQIVNEIEVAFGSLVRGAYTALKYPAPGLLPAGIDNTCGYLVWLKSYFNLVCHDRVLPLSIDQYYTVEDYLIQLEGALSDFKVENGNLCFDMVPMEGCEEWETLLHCLRKFCDDRGTRSIQNRNSFYFTLGPAIDELYWLLKARSNGPRSLTINTLCARIDEIWTLLGQLCPEALLSKPFLADLNRLRGSVRTGLALLKGSMDVCSVDSCDEWIHILHCLVALCDNREKLSQDPDTAGVADILEDYFITPANVVYTRIFGHLPSPPSGTDLDKLCWTLRALLDWFLEHCICASDFAALDPSLREDLADVLLPLFSDAYARIQSCPCSIKSGQIDVTTGIANWIVTETVTGVPVPAGVNIVTDTGGITDPIPGSEWISPLPTANSSQVGWTTFEYCFCLCKSATVRLVLEYFADDKAMIYINNTLLATSVPNMSHSQTVDASVPLVAGKHCLRIRVLNDPALNMALCAKGHLYEVGGELIKGVDCPPEALPNPSGRNIVALTTGLTKWMVTETVTGVPVPAPVNIVTGTGLATPISGSEWISPLTTAASPQIGWTTFERCFCLYEAASVRLVLEYFADDKAMIYVDDTLLATSAPNMSHSETLITTFPLSAGQHCMKIKVLNQPAYNMGLCAKGYLEVAGWKFANELDCLPRTLPSGAYDKINTICCARTSDCGKVLAVSRYHRVFCTRVPNPGDADILALTARMTVVESWLPSIIEALGVELEPASTSFCDRLEHISRAMILAYSNPAVLSVAEYYQLECFYRELESRSMNYAISMELYPVACSECNQFCDQWVELLTCLCQLCSERSALGTAGILGSFYAMLCATITALFEYLQTLESTPGIIYPQPVPLACCDQVARIATFMALNCVRCDHISSTDLETLQGWYDTLAGNMRAFRDVLEPAAPELCLDLCNEWMPMVECLLRLSFHKSELPVAIRNDLAARFTTRIESLFQTIFDAPGLNSPLAADVFDDNGWNLLQVAVELYRICQLPHQMNQSVRADLRAMLPGWKSDYMALQSALATAGVAVCDGRQSVCRTLDLLPEYYALLCAGPADPSVNAVGILIDQVRPYLRVVEMQLGLPRARLTITGTACNKLTSHLSVMAAAYARMDGLRPLYSLHVEFFFRIFEVQARAHKALLGNNIPASTRMSRYRRKWLDLLSCICAVCELDGPLPEDVVESFEEGVGPHIATLYAAIVSTYAPQLSFSVVADLCPDADTGSMRNRCRQLRIIMSFFSMFGLGFDESPNGTYTSVMSALDLAFPLLGEAIAGLRGVLAENGLRTCGEESFAGTAIQSKYLYLQAAGSDQSDGSAEGVHLRWQFRDRLQDHLPKGNLAAPGAEYAADYWFNKPDDFVRIFRAPYTETYPVTISLNTQVPSQIMETATGVEWRYDNLRPDATFPINRSAVVRFKDVAEYHTHRNDRNPKSNATIAFDIIKKYTGILEVEVAASSRSCFGFQADVTVVGSPNMKIEGISYGQKGARLVPIISCREEFTAPAASYKVYSEMAERFRCRYQGCYPTTLKLETYEDYYIAVRRRFGWEQIGEFGLSLDQTEVFTRLEHPVRYPVDGSWPRYRALSEDGDIQDGGKVSVANYRDKWNPNPLYRGRTVESGIRHFVEQYLDKSAEPDGWEGKIDHGSIDADAAESSKVQISTLRMLNFASLDYHIARMLGLGYIDWQVPLGSDGPNQKYIYFAEYETLGKEGSGVPAMMHRFLSLPTGKTDYRLPVEPMIAGHELGLPRFDSTTEPFTDANGYTRYGDARFIRFNKAPLDFDLEQPVYQADQGFFSSAARYSRGRNTMPVLFGVRHRDFSEPEGKWIMPEIANDLGEYAGPLFEPYVDAENNPETIPIPEKVDTLTGEPLNPLLIHSLEKSRDDGRTYQYGIYGINWFSRVSQTRLYASILNTFPKRNTLVAPLNLTAQYIQREMPRSFNSQFEQDATSLHGFTRVQFDWNHIHNREYDRADRVRFLFRENAPEMVRGEIASVVEMGNNEVEIHTIPYDDYSGDEVVHIVPTMQADPARFVGSVLTAGNLHYKVLAARVEGGLGYAVFTVRKEFAQPVQGDAPQVRPGMNAAGGWYAPLPGEMVAVVENLGDAGGWTELPDAWITLVDFTNAGVEHTEIETDRDGRTTELRIGGIAREVSAEEVFGVYPPEHPQAGTHYPTGHYKLTFTGYTLAPYAASKGAAVHHVEWYKGVLRVAGADGQMKVLDVVRIDSTLGVPAVPSAPQPTSPLTIWVYDPAFENVASLIIPRDEAAHPLDVNFHPSYRVYFDLGHDDAVDKDLQVLPQGANRVRQTFIAAVAVDQSEANESPITAPAIHIARRIMLPLPPIAPEGPPIATRPDYYGKSSYTFDVIAVPRSIGSGGEMYFSYAMIFFRASDEDLLRALYKPETIEEIRANVPAVANDPDFVSRWGDLVMARPDPADATAQTFSPYAGLQGDYRLPAPDRSEYEDLQPTGETFHPFVPGRSIVANGDYIRRAIMRRALPLTQTPVLLDLVRTDNALRPSNHPPILVVNDKPVYTVAEGLDLFPMIRKKQDGTDYILRFCDFTLDGASRNFYFYFCVEMNDAGVTSDPSGMLGPVRLINSFPPMAPSIRQVTTQAANPLLDLLPGVVVSVNSYPAFENIRRVVLLRAMTPGGAAAIQMMTEAGSVELPEPDMQGGEYVLEDQFGDLPKPPYGQSLYYRVVAYRRILNEDGILEDVPSLPSDVVMVSVADSRNPAAPTIQTSFSMDGDDIAGLTLSWLSTTPRGEYYLYRQTSGGNWIKLKEYGPDDTLVYDWEMEHPSEPTLPGLTEDGDVIYYRFKVDVRNLSGLMNLQDEVKVVHAP